MLSTAQMDKIGEVLDLARDAILKADDKVQSLKSKEGEETFATACAAVRLLVILNVIPDKQGDQAITDMMTVLFQARGIDPAEANEYCRTRNRLRAEIEEIAKVIET